MARANCGFAATYADVARLPPAAVAASSANVKTASFSALKFVSHCRRFRRRLVLVDFIGARFPKPANNGLPAGLPKPEETFPTAAGADYNSLIFSIIG